MNREVSYAQSDGLLKKYLITISQTMIKIIGHIMKATNQPNLELTQSV